MLLDFDFLTEKKNLKAATESHYIKYETLLRISAFVHKSSAR